MPLPEPPSPPEPDAPEDRVVNLLHDALRGARQAALDEGRDPEEITADITEKVERLRRLNASGWPPQG
ncbi:hypothetical protein ACFFX1_00615 [Dactylosporangium sucinum]|uniref:Uncharacterized protein n=1 Tax=Dactylosporangium sucinum TaxID=1424081 RepID=A0A917WQL2_9ACTN|nr:hypothetical protein [Dactylosporangium sucinum]GGM21549.1 hypothetical protein GCM10007977_023360 [Dactylosporangium sucinum]